MDWIEFLKYIGIILTGVVTAIPLVIKLVEYVKKAVQEKNWTRLLNLLLSLMAQAEPLFDTGAERKDYVMAAVSELSYAVGYDLDEDELSTLIDKLCDMSKVVNAPESEGG